MRVSSTSSLAFAALGRNRMRSLLTALGIVIGVAAVVVMQSMGEGATAYISEEISNMGSNMLILMPGSPQQMGAHAMLGVPLFTLADMDAIRRRAHSVGKVAPANAKMLRVVYGANNHTCTVDGVTPDYFEIRPWLTVAGRGLSEEDNRDGALVALLGSSVRGNLFEGQDPIGKEVRIHNVPVKVVGILEPHGTSAFGIDQDDFIIMPFSTVARRIIGTDRVSVALISSASDQTDDVKEEVTTIMRERRHILPGEDDDFAVRDPREIEALLQSVTGILTIFLSGVAAISLLVGGIGVMNIMLVSVTERTREIGVRLAVGARGSDILIQFLVEASILSVVGGLIGLMIGLLGAYGATQALNIPFVIPIKTIPIALAVSLAVGIGFGVFPARKASRLNPLEALRYE